MEEKELCNMCTEYSVHNECELKKDCKLLNILRENEKLKQENKELQDKVSDFMWEKFPDRMGK